MRGAGLWGACRSVGRRAVAIPSVGFADLQIALYSSYGEIPFLYSANVVPLLIAIAAFAWFTPVRYAAVAAALRYANKRKERKRGPQQPGPIPSGENPETD